MTTLRRVVGVVVLWSIAVTGVVAAIVGVFLAAVWEVGSET